jgi:hypothetical protein
VTWNDVRSMGVTEAWTVRQHVIRRPCTMASGSGHSRSSSYTAGRGVKESMLVATACTCIA